MPVKVRCTSCRKILNLPDKARGRKIRCPNCETKLAIPAATTQTVQKREKVTADRPDSAAFLANLDLGQAEDQNVRICPTCATQVDPDDVECPNCGTDLAATAPGTPTKARRKDKGPDTGQFYRRAFGDALKFLKRHQKFPLRLAATWILFSLISAFCGFWFLRSTTWPPKTFWAFCCFVMSMIPFGFAWFLHLEIIRATMAKKDRMKKVRSDIFQNVAYGMKLFLWMIVFSLPFEIIAGICAAIFWFAEMRIVAFVFLGLGFLAAMCMFPIAMTHMSMPVTYRGWIATRVVGIFGRIPGPTLYWNLLLGVTMLPALAGAGVIGGVYGGDLVDFVGRVQERSAIAKAQAFRRPKTGEIPPEIEALREKDPPSLSFTSLIPPAAIWIVTCFAFGYGATFNMRTNGLFAQMFKPQLSLITQEKELKYVAQPKKDEDGAEPPPVSAGKLLAIVGLGCAIGAAGGVAYSRVAEASMGMAAGLGLLAGAVLFSFVALAMWWRGKSSP